MQMSQADLIKAKNAYKNLRLQEFAIKVEPVEPSWMDETELGILVTKNGTQYIEYMSLTRSEAEKLVKVLQVAFEI